MAGSLPFSKLRSNSTSPTIMNIIKKTCPRTMVFSSSYILVVLSLLYSFFITTTSSSPIPITLFNTIPHSDPYQKLTHLASSSIARALHLKNPKNGPIPTTTPLYPYSGAYSISLSFGTPPQSIPLILDTGSSFSWLPCTKRYICKNCSVPTANISSFVPKLSSSSRMLGCKNPKCGWVHKSFDPETGCKDCQQSDQNCSQICPPYIILYGLGSTGGVPMVETLNMGHEKVEDFLVGCSLFSSNQPAGVAGFGRGISSVPSQLRLRRFSYCLVSHKFDDTPKSSMLFMDIGSDSDKKTEKLSYTNFLKNPVSPNSALADYYYVGLRKIMVGGKKVDIPYEELSLHAGGNGGTIVDSGSTFTYMNKVVFNAVADAFSDKVKGYKRAENVENQTGLRPCFDVTGEETLKMPGLELHFKGGAKMALRLENYFFGVDDGEKLVVCLTTVTDNTVLGPDQVSGGPSVILGNFFMQNFQVEYDLRNERFGFRQESCS